MKKRKISLLVGLFLLLVPRLGHSMHIMEGFLPIKWALAWSLLSLPFVLVGFRRIQDLFKKDGSQKVLLALAASFVFVLSALKIPSVTGSSSHPTGVGLGAVLFGPTTMTIIGLIVLLFQALLLAHGGLTTLGANTFSMAIVGPLVSYGIFKLFKGKERYKGLGVFLAAFLGNIMTYVVTSVQLALAFSNSTVGFAQALGKFLSVFAITQIPLGIVEGIITLIVYNLLREYTREGVFSLEILE